MSHKTFNVRLTLETPKGNQTLLERVNVEVEDKEKYVFPCTISRELQKSENGQNLFEGPSPDTHLSTDVFQITQENTLYGYYFTYSFVSFSSTLTPESVRKPLGTLTLQESLSRFNSVLRTGKFSVQSVSYKELPSTLELTPSRDTTLC